MITGGEQQREDAWRMKVVGVVLGLVMMGFGSVQAFIALPSRMDGSAERITKVEKRVDGMEDLRRGDREILIRIEEQVRQLREALRGRERERGVGRGAGSGEQAGNE